MPWVRFDDTFPIHRKVEGLSDAAFRLHVSAVSWCARNLTDGFVPEGDLELVTARVRSPERFAAELVNRDLWHRAETVTRNGAVVGHETGCDSGDCAAPTRPGWVIHDYLEFQPSKAKVKEEQSKNAERQRRYRERQAAKQQAREGDSQDRNDVTNASRTAFEQRDSNAVSNAVSNGEQTLPRPDPTRKEEAKASSSSVTAPPTRPEVEKLCRHLADRMIGNGFKPPTIGKKWLDAARLLLDADKRDFDEAMELIDWCQDSTFWRSNIKSMTKFRDQYDTLRLQRQDRPGSAVAVRGGNQSQDRQGMFAAAYERAAAKEAGQA